MGKVSKIVRGASPRPIKDPKWFEKDSHVGWIRISDVTEQNGRIRHLTQHLSKAGETKTRVLEQPHLLLSIAASVGFPAINYVPIGVHDGFLIFLNSKFNIDYMFYWLEKFRPLWRKYGQPGSQINLNSDIVSNTRLALPKEAEQSKVSNFLNKVELLITLQQRKLEQLTQLKKAMLQQLFADKNSKQPNLRFKNFKGDWEQHKLKSVVSVNSGKDYKSLEKGNIPVYGTGGYITSVSKSLSNQDAIGLGRKGTINKPYILKAPFWTVDTLFYLTLKPENILTFIYSLIQKINWLKYDESTGLPSLSKKNIKNVLVSLTKLDEQQKIGKVIVKLDKFITLHQSKIDQLTILKKYLLQKLFI